MTASDLIDRFRAFQSLLIEHRQLWRESLTGGGVIPAEVYRNHESLEEQRRRLYGMFGALNPYISKYSLVRQTGAYNQSWDAFLSAVSDDVALRKSMSFDLAIPAIDGIIGALEMEPPGVDLAIARKPVQRRSRRVFITHGKHSGALDQIERFVENLGCEPIIVKYEPSKGAAVDDLVPGLMASCDAVIVLATADDDVAGKLQARPNVMHEVGVAQQMLADRVIYLREDGCHYPSNVGPKVWEDFTQDNLAPAYMKIVKELRAFGLI